MSSRAGRCNSNERGSSYDRRARRAWLLSPISGFGGDGEKVACWECGAMVNDKTMIVDRIIPGEEGGRYRRDNIRPHCSTCSCRQGQRRTTEIARAKSAYGDDDCCLECRAHYLADHADGCTLRERELAETAPGWA
ncbi:HNH endonuclease [Mycobacterium phage Serendipitous]|uniref:HNH endonuclease n=1 Tax=Mycobacterium phage Serendipitous TaxID=2301619 RepID=A0A385UL48_9CAUD|nr:HNH endonuclease [Mycobacterium phage Serendipitous]AYB70617.1 HNH endonuclease [Mycobacterium phage Serendipitous]